jgi:crotonobetaine/carnitine-CoA ligase
MTDFFLSKSADSWTLPSALRTRAELSPDAVFVRFGDQRAISFAMMQRRALAAACWLSGQGVARGQIVALAMPNSDETLVWWFALNLLGAIDAAINPSLRGEPLAHALRLVRARRVLAHPDLLPRFMELEQNLPDLEKIWLVPDGVYLDGELPATRFGIEVVSPVDSDGLGILPRGISEPQPQDVATIIYTSGTTGPAKAVQMTYAQVFVVAELTRQGLWLSADDTTYCAHPLFHMAARDCGVLPCLITGGSLALDVRFEPDKWVDRIIATGATSTLMHGPLIEMVHAQPKRPEDSQMPLTRLGSSPFPRQVASAFERRFRVKGIETWGMTEIGIPAWHPPNEALRPGSCGKVRDDWFEFRVADPQTGAPVPDGTVGEFQVRPKRPGVVMVGYYGQPALSDADWFQSGDFGLRDPEGWLWFSGRAADRIRRRGENISAYDIERAAGSIPRIQESAAIGVPSGYASDDDILLCVLPTPDAPSLEPAALLRQLAVELPHHMLPRYIRIMKAMPRSATGKIRKETLKADFQASDCWDRQAEGVSVRSLYSLADGAAPDPE